MTTTEFDGARSLVEYLLEDQRFRTLSYFDATSRGVNGFIFRGQRTVPSKLLPSAHRSAERLRSFTPQEPVPMADPEGWMTTTLRDKCLTLMQWMHAEIRAVHLFLEQADKLGLRTPLDYRALHAHQPAVDAVAQEKPESWRLPFPSDAYLPSIAMAQHYGVPTRLLDWTESPLVAAYFAAEGASLALSNGEANQDGVISIAMLASGRLPMEIWKEHLAIALAPRFMNDNLRAQKGVFVYALKANEYFMEHGEWPGIDDVLVTARGGRYLETLTLPAAQSDDLLRLLWRYDVTRHHLMPNLENAARAVGYARALFPHLRSRFYR